MGRYLYELCFYFYSKDNLGSRQSYCAVDCGGDFGTGMEMLMAMGDSEDLIDSLSRQFMWLFAGQIEHSLL